MIVFKVLIVIFVIAIWRLTYPMVSLWINNHVNLGSRDILEKTDENKKEK